MTSQHELRSSTSMSGDEMLTALRDASLMCQQLRRFSIRRLDAAKRVIVATTLEMDVNRERKKTSQRAVPLSVIDLFRSLRSNLFVSFSWPA